jgi:hypothetical protein
LQILRERGPLAPGNPTDPARRVFRSETGQVTIDGARDILTLDTERTAGGYAPVGSMIEAPIGGFTAQVRGADATVWLSALDDQPIRSSRRLLLTHLTDLQNTSIRYAEPERQTLLDWGQLPHLVRVGQAEIGICLERPGEYEVWALGPSGRRLARLATRTEAEALRFTIDVAGDRQAGARFLYEIAVR